MSKWCYSLAQAKCLVLQVSFFFFFSLFFFCFYFLFFLTSTNKGFYETSHDLMIVDPISVFSHISQLVDVLFMSVQTCKLKVQCRVSCILKILTHNFLRKLFKSTTVQSNFTQNKCTNATVWQHKNVP